MWRPSAFRRTKRSPRCWREPISASGVGVSDFASGAACAPLAEFAASDIVTAVWVCPLTAAARTAFSCRKTAIWLSWPTLDRRSRLATDARWPDPPATLSPFAVRLAVLGTRRQPAAARPSASRAADVKAGRRHLAGRYDDARAHLGPAVHLHRERHRHPDTAMRRRIARQHAGMHRDTRPGDPLHERHRGAAIDVGMMQLLLLDHAEGAHRRRMAGHAGGNRRFRKEAVGVVYPQILRLIEIEMISGPCGLAASFTGVSTVLRRVGASVARAAAAWRGREYPASLRPEHAASACAIKPIVPATVKAAICQNRWARNHGNLMR